MTTTTQAVLDWLKPHLEQTLTGVLIHDGVVPEAAAVYPGTQRIRPYVVIWHTPLREPVEVDLAYETPARTGDVTLTVAADSPATVRTITDYIIGALHRTTGPAGGEYRHAQPHVPTQHDRQVHPPRFYEPLTFRLHTTT